MRIAITGGTGFIGTHLARELATAGHEVILVARKQRFRTLRAGVTFVRADVVSSDKLMAAFTGCTAVVHLAGVMRERGAQTFDLVNRQGADEVAKAAARADVPHLIHLSVIGATPDPAIPFLTSKWEGEQAVRMSGAPFTILRSSVAFGPGDEFFTRIARIMRFAPAVPLPAGGRTVFQPIAVGDVVQCLLEVITSGPRHAVIEIGGPEHLSYSEIARTIANQLGLRRFFVAVPINALRIMTAPLRTSGQLLLLRRHSVTRTDSVMANFGFAPTPFRDDCEYLEDY